MNILNLGEALYYQNIQKRWMWQIIKALIFIWGHKEQKSIIQSGVPARAGLTFRDLLDWRHFWLCHLSSELLIQIRSVSWRQGPSCSLRSAGSLSVLGLLRQQIVCIWALVPLWGIWDVVTFWWPLKTFRQGAYWLSAMIYVSKDREGGGRHWEKGMETNKQTVDTLYLVFYDKNATERRQFIQ